MKLIGLIMTFAGFIASSAVAVLEKESLNWFYFVPLFLIGLTGTVLYRIATRKSATCAQKIGSDIQKIDESLTAITGNIAKLEREKEIIDVYDMHDKIDEMIAAHIEAFVESRESLIHKFNMQSYADIMNHFSAAERYLNRSWSASADGYIDEVYDYLSKAEKQFKVTKELFDRIKNSDA